MYNKKIRNLLKKPQPNSGFTLTELLTGLIMSIFVTGALGFGLYQIMSATGAERAKANARSEASRAVEFISDELRRAQTIEPNANNATGFNSSGKTVVLALNVPGQNSRIVYYLKDKSNSDNWQGPQILYRWGPPLDDEGNYTTGTWQEEALIDGIDDTPITANPCETGDSLTPTLANSPSGFYACINSTSTAAEIFLTGGIDADVIAGNDSNYTANTKAVARAKDVTVNAAQAAAVAPISFRSLEADYICNPETSSLWTMRTDFDNTSYNSAGERPDRNEATKWIHEPNRQAQPIDIDSNNDLILTSLPIEATDCLSKGNQGADVSQLLSDFVGNDGVSSQPDTHSVSHIMKLKQKVLNRPGDPEMGDPYYYQTFNGNTVSNYDNPNVNEDGTVQVFKNGSKILLGAAIPDINDLSSNTNVPARGYPGYKKSNNPNEEARPTLGDFLIAKGFAKYTNGVDNTGGYTIENLKPNERIIAFEVGQDDNGIDDPNGKAAEGFDLQDNVFIMRHDAFGETHPKTSSNTENN